MIPVPPHAAARISSTETRAFRRAPIAARLPCLLVMAGAAIGSGACATETHAPPGASPSPSMHDTLPADGPATIAPAPSQPRAPTPVAGPAIGSPAIGSPAGGSPAIASTAGGSPAAATTASETGATGEVVIPEADASAAETADGYGVDVAVRGLTYPTSVEFDDAGAMYIAEGGYMPGDMTQPARILKCEASGSGTDLKVVATDLQRPITDLLWHDGRLYISHKGRISVLEHGAVRDLVTGLPSFGDHSNDQMSIGPDGRLYFGQGSATNSGVVGPDDFSFGWPKEHPEVCDVPGKDITVIAPAFESPDPRAEVKGELPSKVDPTSLAHTSAFHPFGQAEPAGSVVRGAAKANGAILSMKTDGTDLAVYAWGFRNPYGVLWTPDGRLCVADAGSDERGSRPIAHAPEKLWLVERDTWYGWPDFEGGIPVTDPVYASKRGPAPQFLLRDHPPVPKPWLTFESHASITQLDVGRSADFGRIGDLYLASSGDESEITAAEKVRAGYWVRRIDPSSGKSELFFRAKPAALGPSGLEHVVTAGPRRFVDLRFSPAGDALYIVDIGPMQFTTGEKGPEPRAFPHTGVIWRVQRMGAPKN
jgi:glucose/arabinose dehydrogenase